MNKTFSPVQAGWLNSALNSHADRDVETHPQLRLFLSLSSSGHCLLCVNTRKSSSFAKQLRQEWE